MSSSVFVSWEKKGRKKGERREGEEKKREGRKEVGNQREMWGVNENESRRTREREIIKDKEKGKKINQT